MHHFAIDTPLLVLPWPLLSHHIHLLTQVTFQLRKFPRRLQFPFLLFRHPLMIHYWRHHSAILLPHCPRTSHGVFQVQAIRYTHKLASYLWVCLSAMPPVRWWRALLSLEVVHLFTPHRLPRPLLALFDQKHPSAAWDWHLVLVIMHVSVKAGLEAHLLRTDLNSLAFDIESRSHLSVEILIDQRSGWRLSWPMTGSREAPCYPVNWMIHSTQSFRLAELNAQVQSNVHLKPRVQSSASVILRRRRV